MRWPFRRQAPADASPVGAEALPQASVAERRPEAWRELEPLRTIEPVELTADGRRFSEDLGVHHPLELALRPLGHDLALEAPQGIVSGIAHAVAAPDRGLELPLVPPPRPEAPPAPVVRARRPVQTAPAAPAPAPASAPYAPPEAAATSVSEPEPFVTDAPVDAPSAPELPLVTPAPARQLASVPLPSARPGQSRGSELPLVPRPVQAVASAAPPAFASAPAPAPVAPASSPAAAVEQSSAPATYEPPAEVPVVLAAEVVEESELPPRTPESTHLPIVGLRHEPTFETAQPPVSTGDSPRTPPLADVQSDAPPVIRRPGHGAPIVRDPERASSGPATPLPPLARAEPAPAPPAGRPAVPRPAQREVSPPVRPVRRARVDEPPVVPAEPNAPERAPDLPPVAPLPATSAPPSGELPDRLAPPARREEASLVGVEDIRRTDAPRVLATPSLAQSAETPSTFEPPVQPITRAVPAVTASPASAPAIAATTMPLTPAPASRPVQRAAASASPSRGVSAPLTAAFSAREPSRVPTPVDSRPGVPPAPAMPVRPLVGLHALAPERGDTADEQGSPSTPSPSDAPVVRRLAAVPDATSALTAPPAALPLAATAAAMGLPAVAAAASAPPMPWPAPMRAAPVPAGPLPEPQPPALAAAPAPAHNGTSPARRAVQRAVQIPELQVNSTGGTPAAGSAPAQTPEQLREQVIRWIRAELLVNRERAGRLTDLR